MSIKCAGPLGGSDTVIFLGLAGTKFTPRTLSSQLKPETGISHPVRWRPNYSLQCQSVMLLKLLRAVNHFSHHLGRVPGAPKQEKEVIVGGASWPTSFGFFEMLMFGYRARLQRELTLVDTFPQSTTTVPSTSYKSLSRTVGDHSLLLSRRIQTFGVRTKLSMIHTRVMRHPLQAGLKNPFRRHRSIGDMLRQRKWRSSSVGRTVI